MPTSRDVVNVTSVSGCSFAAAGHRFRPETSLGLTYFRLMLNRKIHRPRKEALGVSRVVQFACPCHIGARRDGKLGTQDDTFEMSRTVGCLLHHTFGMVDIGQDNNPGLSTQMEVPKLMACGERSDQQFLRIPTRRIAAKCGIGGAWYQRLLCPGGYFVLPLVASIAGCASAGVAGPLDGDSVAVRFCQSAPCERQFNLTIAPIETKRRIMDTTTAHRAMLKSLRSSRRPPAAICPGA